MSHKKNCSQLYNFYNNMEKVRAELALFSLEKAHVSDIIFIVGTL